MSSPPPPPPLSPLSGYVPPAPPRSAVDALMPAWEHTKQVLFSPFRARKWLKLGLIALLAGVVGGGGGGGGTGGGPGGGGGSGSGSGPDPAALWAQIVDGYHAHTAEVLAGAAAVGLLIVGFSLVMLYVSSVFRFIFLESVITNETRIRESWHRNRAEGLSFFWWRLGFGTLAFLIVALLVGLPVTLMVLSLTGSSGSPTGVGAVLGIVGVALIGIFLLVVVALVLGLISALTRDFVLPLMYLRRIRVLEAWRQCWGIVTANKGGFVVYFLMKAVAAFVSGIAGMLLALGALLVACLPLALLGGIGYFVVVAAGIDSWSWWYLCGIVPVGVVLLMALAYWVTCWVLPVPVYFQSYALKYLGYVEPSAAAI